MGRCPCACEDQVVASMERSGIREGRGSPARVGQHLATALQRSDWMPGSDDSRLLPTRKAGKLHSMKTVSIDVEVDQDVLARLARLSEQRHCSTRSLAQAAVIQYLEREERSEREGLEDRARCRRYEDIGECLSQKDMTDWLESKAKEAAERARER